MKAAILGFGRMGEHVLQALRDMPEISRVIAYDVDPLRRDPALRLGADFSPSLDAVLRDPEVRLVFITSPNHTHSRLAGRALRAGKAVLLEKPIAETFRKSRHVVELAEELGTYLQIGFELRYSHLYRWVKDAIETGQIGSVVGVDCRYLCSEFHGKGSWRNDPATGGGMFAEKLCHYIDLPRWWLSDEIECVASFSAPNVVPYFQVRDNYRAIYRFAGGAAASIHFVMYSASAFAGDPLQNTVSQQLDDGHELRFLVTGSCGALETDVFRRRFRRWEFTDSPKGLISRLVETKSWPEDADHFHFHNTTAQAQDCVRRVLRGLPPAIAPMDALATMAAVEATEKSTDAGRMIRPGSLRSRSPACGK